VLREPELAAPLPELALCPITAFLIAEAVRIVTLCPDRRVWARRNLIDLVIIAAAAASLPFTGIPTVGSRSSCCCGSSTCCRWCTGSACG
jgi:uncharacterized membrane protein YfbV (UPF0208 family)